MAEPNAVEIVVPRLGWSMDEGTFVEWLKEDGGQVEVGDMLFVLESEKAAQEVESFDAGILRIPPEAPLPGDTVKVGQLLGYIVPEGQPLPPFEHRAEPGRIETSKRGPEPDPLQKTEDAARSGEPGTLPAQSEQTVKISPRARRVARELGIDWTLIRGTGKGGRIREEDIRAVSEGADALPGAKEQREAFTLPGRYIPVTPIRLTIAQRMSAGINQAAPCTLSSKVVASKLVAFRERLKLNTDGVLASYTDIFIKLVALALKEHPLMTGQWHDKGILIPSEINIAFAVNTESGLFAPVIRSADLKSLSDIASESSGLIRAARDSRLKVEQMQGGVFTVTNLGAHGIDGFTPIINLPQSAILGVGRIRREPIVASEAIEIQHTMKLSLTFDHRVIDGAPAAGFLDRICELIDGAEDALGPS